MGKYFLGIFLLAAVNLFGCSGNRGLVTKTVTDNIESYETFDDHVCKLAERDVATGKILCTVWLGRFWQPRPDDLFFELKRLYEEQEKFAAHQNT